VSAADDAKARQQVTWAAGDYASIGARLVIVSELLCEAVDLRATDRVLDVATGHGNTALAAARRGCGVTGVDITPALLEQARRRATAEHLRIEFRAGDATELPFPDEAFDVVLSTFGAPFLSNPASSALELLRVCRSGGKIGLANWTPTGANLAEGRVADNYFPPAPGSYESLLSIEERLQQLLGGQVVSLRATPGTVVYRFRSIEAYVDTLRTTFGPFMRRMESLDAERQSAMRRDLAGALAEFNRSGDETMVIPFDYLEVVAIKR